MTQQQESQVELKARWALLGRKHGLKILSNRGDRITLTGEVSSWESLKKELHVLRQNPDLDPHEKGSLTAALRRVNSAIGQVQRMRDIRAK